jgi:UDP-N-acetylmuramoyl-tripeptide--D-alanyl-D-alanine ligase
MKKFLIIILKILAKLLLKRYKPKIVSITGSVGKTSTKEASYYILKRYFKVRTSYKNYNNEIGVPLTIIGQKSAKKSIINWLLIFLKAIFLLIKKDKNYPEILILEMGIDRPGDMQYLCNIAKPDIAIVTAIGTAHIEYFQSKDKIIKEKQVLIENLKADGLGILNQDQIEVAQMANLSPAKSVSFGFNEDADLRAVDYFIDIKEGSKLKLNYQGSLLPANFKNIFSSGGIYACLAALLIANHFNVNILKASKDLINFSLPAGRLQPLLGINNSLIIDDSYNASPESVILAIESISSLKNKILVLGDILEIGEHIKQASVDIAAKIIKNNFSQVITKGDIALIINRELLAQGYSQEKLHHFTNTNLAISYLKKQLDDKQALLIKGSQGARMEIIVKALLKNPVDDQNKLVRQEKDWLKDS